MNLRSNLLQVRDLEVAFPIKGGLFNRTVDQFKAVNQVSFDVWAGKTVGFGWGKR